MTDQNQNTPQQQIIVHAQYVRDSSFENPHVPDSLKGNQTQLQVEIGFNIGSRSLGDNQGQELFETILKLAATGKREDKSLYMAEVEYGAVVSLPGVADNLRTAMLHVEVPRLLFPFARQQIFNMIQDGGHPPLLMPPIDFVSFFQEQMVKTGKTAPDL
ncbi:MAG: protein-export chaperone SecB [Pseudomonadota bacterium]